MNFKLYLDNLNSLFTEYNNEAKLQNKSELSEETKVLYSLQELNKVGIAYSFTFLYDEKTFKGLKEDITKLSTIIKKSKSIKRVEIKQVFNMKIKLTESEIGNSHIISIKKQIPTNTANIAIKMGTLLITVFSTYQIHQIITIGVTEVLLL